MKEKKKEVPVVYEKKKLTIDEIRKLIASANASSVEFKKTASAQLVKEIEESKGWKKTVKVTEAVEERKTGKPQHGTQRDIQKGGKTGDAAAANPSQDFQRGKNYGKIPPANTGPTFDIQIGKNENLETRLIKNKLKEKAA